MIIITPMLESVDGWQLRLEKCATVMQLTVYATLLALGLYALHDQAYLTDSTEFWKGWPSQNIP